MLKYLILWWKSQLPKICGTWNPKLSFKTNSHIQNLKIMTPDECWNSEIKREFKREHKASLININNLVCFFSSSHDSKPTTRTFWRITFKSFKYLWLVESVPKQEIKHQPGDCSEISPCNISIFPFSLSKPARSQSACKLCQPIYRSIITMHWHSGIIQIPVSKAFGIAPD